MNKNWQTTILLKLVNGGTLSMLPFDWIDLLKLQYVSGSSGKILRNNISIEKSTGIHDASCALFSMEIGAITFFLSDPYYTPKRLCGYTYGICWIANNAYTPGHHHSGGYKMRSQEKSFQKIQNRYDLPCAITWYYPPVIRPIAPYKAVHQHRPDEMILNSNGGTFTTLGPQWCEVGKSVVISLTYLQTILSQYILNLPVSFGHIL